jgi:hypothetical protein
LWETVLVPKANLRLVPGKGPFREFECSICKTRFAGILDISDLQAVGILKAAMFRRWDAHLYAVHRRQWDFQQKRNAKREAPS